MNTNDYTIRLEKKEEYRVIENLVREAFWNVYRPGCSEHYVMHVLRDDPAFGGAGVLLGTRKTKGKRRDGKLVQIVLGVKFTSIFAQLGTSCREQQVALLGSLVIGIAMCGIVGAQFVGNVFDGTCHGW